MCDEKKSRIRCRAAERAVKIEGNAVPGTASAKAELGCTLGALDLLGQPHLPERKSGSGGSEQETTGIQPWVVGDGSGNGGG